MRKHRAIDDVKLIAALVAGLAAALAISFVGSAVIPYALAASFLLLGVLWWRKRDTPDDFALRFGAACLAFALLSIFLRSLAVGAAA